MCSDVVRHTGQSLVELKPRAFRLEAEEVERLQNAEGCGGLWIEVCGGEPRYTQELGRLLLGCLAATVVETYGMNAEVVQNSEIIVSGRDGIATRVVDVVA